jgi:hypothetical protein
MSRTLLFSIGTVVFAATIVAAMVYGRHAFARVYDKQVAEAQAYVRPDIAGAAAASAAAAALTADAVQSPPLT